MPGPRQQIAFDTLKRIFITVPVLVHWNPEAPVTVEMDASDHALAAILSIHIKEDIHPIAFYSRTFNSAELNYNVHYKKLLAIYETFKKWRHYLERTPRPVDVVTDHKNLTYFSRSKLLTRWQTHWSEYLAQFNLLIQFRPGHLGTKPDALTQRLDLYPIGGNKSSETMDLFNYHPLFTKEQLALLLRAAQLSNPSLSTKPF